MLSYDFYINEYNGNSIEESEWPNACARAEDILEKFKRLYTVEGEDVSFNKAICAIAESVVFFDTVPTGSSSIGSVSTSAPAVDISPKAQNKEYYRAASLYLEFYRGV